MITKQLLGMFIGCWMIYAVVHFIAAIALRAVVPRQMLLRAQVRVHVMLFGVFCLLFGWFTLAAFLLTI